jgi:hypothetical protein
MVDDIRSTVIARLDIISRYNIFSLDANILFPSRQPLKLQSCERRGAYVKKI